MITTGLLDGFLGDVGGQALREGTRYAREARVGDLVGSTERVSTVVRGRSGDFEVVLWAEAGKLAHRCSCPSWRDPCKHEVAAALVLKQSARRKDAAGPRLPADTDEPRRRAVEERVVAARREALRFRPDRVPFLTGSSASGFVYRVHLRGSADGPHSCDCPDFEANRLHTCKHVERVRGQLRRAPGLPAAHRHAASRPRVYLHFGEIVEPRLFGTPAGPGSRAVLGAFDPGGRVLRPLARGEGELKAWLTGLGEWVEPEAIEWLDRRIAARPVLPMVREFSRLVPGLRGSPYDYQWEGAAFLARAGRGLLADEMGLGKTVQAIVAAVALRRATPAVGRVTVVCPASLRGGWREEIFRWLGEEPVLLEGGARARAGAIAAGAPWLVTHYEQLLKDHREHAASPPDLLIIDEAQRAKGLNTRTARVLKSIGARFLFALTGTPLENRLEEAYAIAQLVDQRLLPPLWQIDRDHFVREGKGKRVVLYRNLDALRARLAPAFLRRRKEDVAMDLPERVRSTVMVPMHPAVGPTYEDVMAQVAILASRRVLLPADLDRMQRLLVIARRCCNGPHMLGIEAEDAAVPKLAELEEVLRDLCIGEGRKAVVFSEWTDMTGRVERMCDRLGLPVFHLRGSVPVRARPALIQAFRESPGAAVFVSTDAGGLGLNLQVADVLVNLDLPWNPARLEQRAARVHRIGSKGTVQEILLVAKDSIEERILRLHDTKKDVLENVWVRTGKDEIAAPGGSGAFREMVQALLSTRAPRVEEGLLVAEGAPSPARAGGAAGPAGSTAGPRPAAPAPPRVPAAAAVTPGSPPAPAPARPQAAWQVDPSALAFAMSAVAPTLPPDHRRSLSAVFRAMADALEASPGAQSTTAAPSSRRPEPENNPTRRTRRDPCGVN